MPIYLHNLSDNFICIDDTQVDLSFAQPAKPLGRGNTLQPAIRFLCFELTQLS